jgi:hypothetical protein
MDMYDTATAKGMHMNMIEQVSMPTDMCRTLSFRHSRDSYLRGRCQSFGTWANIMDCIWYPYTALTVCTSASIVAYLLTRYLD